MSFLLEFIFTIIFEVLFYMPGVLVLWAYKGFKGSFSSLFLESKDGFAACAIGIGFWITLIAIVGVF